LCSVSNTFIRNLHVILVSASFQMFSGAYIQVLRVKRSKIDGGIGFAP